MDHEVVNLIVRNWSEVVALNREKVAGAELKFIHPVEQGE